MLLTVSPVKWSLITSSQAFSVFSGVLAAFMFAAIVLLLTRELVEYSGGRFKSAIAPDIAPPIAFMFGALFSLVIAAFLFAAMTGYSDQSGVAQFFEGIMPSLVLSLGVVQMAVGLAWLFDARRLGGTPAELARYIVGGTIVVVAMFLTGVVVSPWFQAIQMDSLLGIHLHPWLGLSGSLLGAILFWIGLAVVVMIAIPVGEIGQVWLRRPARNSPIEKGARQRGGSGRLRQRFVQRDQITRWVNIASIVMAVFAAIGWSVVSAFSDSLEALYISGTIQVPLVAGALLMMAMFAALEVAMPGPAASDASTPD